MLARLLRLRPADVLAFVLMSAALLVAAEDLGRDALAQGVPAAQGVQTSQNTQTSQDAPAATQSQAAPNGSGTAAPPSANPPAAAPASPALPPDAARPAELKAIRDSFETAKLRLNEAEAALARQDLTDSRLTDLRAQVDQATQMIQTGSDSLSPRLTAAQARLDGLGPKPKPDQPAESPETARDRQERERDIGELDEATRAGKALMVQANQITANIVDRRRTLFTNALFQRSWSLLSPDLWLTVMHSAPGDLKAITTITSDWLAAVSARVTSGRVLPLVFALVAALVIYLSRRRLAPRVTARNDAITAPTRLRRALAAAWRTVFATLPAALAGYFIYMGLDASRLLPQGVEPIIRSILIAGIFVAFTRSLAEAILAPSAPSWRCVDMPDSVALPIYRLVFVGSLVAVIGRVWEVVLQTISAPLASSAAVKAVVALVLALLLADALRRMRSSDECEDNSLGPYIPTEPQYGDTVRVIGWGVVVLIVGALIGGFVVLASFIVQQCVWIALVAAALMLALAIVDETVGRTLTGEGRITVALQTSVGLRKRSLDQVAVIASGVLRVVLIAIALLLVLAPWGIDSTDFTSSLNSLFFGLQVAGVTISISTVLAAVVWFVVAVVVTRSLQGWLKAKYLPVTGLDSGLQNSIVTAVSYIGFFLAVALAAAQLGLSLDKIAIVAGALSVGIGFGLQSIVNNFVSGLILLWERSISVGDWIVVGAEQGYVRRISVRATEIQTFERASVIVPNSNLVSGVVKNWLHNNRIGRIAIVVTVPFQPDPTRVSSLLLACATGHPDVLKDPKPSVLFNKFTDSSQEFELRCFADVEATLRIKSELNFQLFERLTAEKIYLAPGVPLSEVKVHLPQELEERLEALIGAAQGSGRAKARSPAGATGAGKRPGKTDSEAEAEPEPVAAEQQD